MILLNESNEFNSHIFSNETISDATIHSANEQIHNIVNWNQNQSSPCKQEQGETDYSTSKRYQLTFVRLQKQKPIDYKVL